MSYPIDITIPDAPNDPADDQPLMKQNFININSYLQVDHVTAGSPGNGFHKEVTFYSKNAAGLPVDPTSVLYTADGTASTVADMRFRNANGIFPVNCIRAVLNFTTINAVDPVGTVVTRNSYFNIDSVTYQGSQNYDIVITSGAVQDMTTKAPIIHITADTNTRYVNYTIVGVSTIRINTSGGAGFNINLQVIQI